MSVQLRKSKRQTCEKTVHNQCIIKKSPHYNFSVGSYTEFMEESFKVSSTSVDSGRWNTQENYLWKSQTKANSGLLRSCPFHIIFKKSNLLILDMRNRPFITSEIQRLPWEV